VHASFPSLAEDWQMDIVIFALVAIVVVVAGIYVMRPEKHQ
jgi:hypothetical protein